LREAENNLFARAVGAVQRMPDTVHAPAPKTNVAPVARCAQ
jgi:hypothetical protein